MAKNVIFVRGNTATINSTAITDGQLLYDTTTGQHYIDNESTRVEVGKPVVNTSSEVLAITADNIPCGTKPVKELITNLNQGNLTFDYDTDGLYYNVQVGADTVRKKCSGKEIILLGTASTYNLTSYDGYSNFTTDDFIVEVQSTASPSTYISDGFYYGQPGYHWAQMNFSKSYDSSTGIFTVSSSMYARFKNAGGNIRNSTGGALSIKVYLIL